MFADSDEHPLRPSLARVLANNPFLFLTVCECSGSSSGWGLGERWGGGDYRLEVEGRYGI